MIKSVTVNKLRGIREGSLNELGALTVLTGRNGCGKSTILDALNIAASRNPGEALGRTVARRLASPAGAQWLMYRGLAESTAEVIVKIPDSRVPQQRCWITWQDRPSRDQPANFTQPVSELMWHSQLEGDERRVFFAVVVDVDNRYRSYAFDEHLLPDSPWVRLVDPGTPHPLHRSFGEQVKRGQRAEVEDLARAVIPTLESLQILTDGDRPYLAIELANGRGAVPVSLAGDGVQALLQVVLELSGPPGGVVLLEEPEVHQHPAALVATAKAIHAARRRGIQVVVTTHSLELIDALVNEADQEHEDLDAMVLFLLNLRDGQLSAGRFDGPMVAYSRNQIEDDLR